MSTTFIAAAGQSPAFSLGQRIKDSVIRNPVRRLGFYSMIGVLFFQFSRLHETLSFMTGTNTFVLYLFTIPALIALVGSGGLGRVLKERAVWFWLGFTLWMAICIPFSYWRGGSMQAMMPWIRVVIPTMFIFAGLPMTWKEFRRMLYVMAIAGLVIVMTARFFTADFGGRGGVEFGLIGNPDDYDGHLFAVMPFVIYMIICRPDWPLLGSLGRLLGAGSLVYALYLILMSGSRGAEIALGFCALYIFWKGSTKVRMISIFVLPLVLAALVTVVPHTTLVRLMSFSLSPTAGQAEEAIESARSRQQLLTDSIKLSFTHPLFGVGPDQFANFEGGTAKSAGTRGSWLSTHNSYTQISSENGLPAIFFYVAAIITTFAMLRDVGKKVRGRPELRQISIAVFCISVALASFLVAIAFLNFGYFFYLPAFTGIIISMRRAAVDEIARLQPSTAAPLARTHLPAAPLPQPRTFPAVRPADVPATRSANRFRFNRMR